MFFGYHTPADPTWAGTQYRSAICVYTPEQKELAELAVTGQGTIGTFVGVEDASDFYRAEEYHQNFLDKL
jgi:peptide methionine sulfoxide reductase MsrA